MTATKKVAVEGSGKMVESAVKRTVKCHALKRRDFLRSGLQTGLLLSSAPGLSFAFSNKESNKTRDQQKSQQIEESPWLFSACDNEAGKHFIYGVNLQSKKSHAIPVEQRFHGVCSNGRHAVFVARRPGNSLKLVDLHSGELLQTVQADTQRHYFGHGVFSADGTRLYVTENAYSASSDKDIMSETKGYEARGMIGVYRVAETIEKIHEFPVMGIGPHELALLPDDKTLVVAVGGILTHPQAGRQKLNLGSIQSSLSYLDRHSGELLLSVPCPYAELSLRHLTVTADKGKVIVGAQYEGSNKAEAPSLLFSHSLQKNEKNLTPLIAEDYQWQSHNAYIASVAVDSQSKYILASTPRGNLISLWGSESGLCKNTFAVSDVSGVGYAEDFGGFIVSTGKGRVFILDPAKQRLEPLLLPDRYRWDNHLTVSGFS